MTGARPGDSDEALVRAVAGGSDEALAALYDRHAASIYATAYRLTGDRQVAEEVVQEAFLALWNRADTFDPSAGTAAGWLRAIGRNRAIDRLRAMGRRPLVVATSAAEGLGDEADGSIERSLAHGTLVGGSSAEPGPEARAELDEVHDLLRAAIGAMAEDERTVIALAYGDGLSQSEIAARLDWPLGTVKTRTRRALRHLREVLAAELGPALAPVEEPVTTGEDGRG